MDMPVGQWQLVRVNTTPVVAETAVEQQTVRMDITPGTAKMAV